MPCAAVTFSSTDVEPPVSTLRLRPDEDFAGLYLVIEVTKQTHPFWVRCVSMHMSRICAFALFLIISILYSVAAVASPGLPCMTATQSANGRVLVTDTLSFEDPDESHPSPIVRSLYQVYRRYTNPNTGLQLKGPDTYWADPFWKVQTDQAPGTFPIACSYVLVPDDGEYLVFVGKLPGSNALTIYHHRAYDPAFGPFVSQQGEFVRQIMQSELWPSDPQEHIFTDHTPLWFAGGTFSFSADQKTLNYQDQHSRKIAIDLATGEIRHSDW